MRLEIYRDRFDGASAIAAQSQQLNFLAKKLGELRAGDRVTLRTPDEIRATLDENGCLEGLPFMPEMLTYFGKAFHVAKRAEKICDTICPMGSRRMVGCVYLDDLRCSGAAHGGCEAECRIYWKEAWLVRLPSGEIPSPPDEAALTALRAFIEPHTRQRKDPELFRCQVTQAREATAPLPGWDLRQYVREFTSGNTTLGRLLSVGLRAISYESALAARILLARVVSTEKLRQLMRSGQSKLRPHSDDPAPLDLQPGDWVEVRSAAEIKKTLNARGLNRGLSFSEHEMGPACGKMFKVRRRINRIIDEPTGRMLEMKHSCIVLEGLACTGDRSVRRWFCDRGIFPYWREAWLKRTEDSGMSLGSSINRGS